MRALALVIVLAVGPARAEPDFPLATHIEVRPAEVLLGQLLFYDPILSGSGDVACATCHHPRFATTDGLSLGLGAGGAGLGPNRRANPANPPSHRLPRNTPALFNLGFTEFQTLFADGRLSSDPAVAAPLGAAAVHGFGSVLAAQAAEPVLSTAEMGGPSAEAETTLGAAAARVARIPEYAALLSDIHGTDTPVTFAMLAQALAAFTAFEWRADASPFDRYLAGEASLDPAQMRGMALFYGEAGCSMCHAGRFQTDHGFHAIAMPQLGPGPDPATSAEDLGRMRVTGDPADAYAFRTPSLRNVTETAPYGHAGAYATLEAVIRHHLDPVASLFAYDRSQVRLPPLAGAEDWRVMDDGQALRALARANDLAPIGLSDAEVGDVVAFLGALTDPASLEGVLGVPDAVPSGFDVPR